LTLGRICLIHSQPDVTGTAVPQLASSVDPQDVSLQTALEALVDPVRRSILRQLDGIPDWSRACGLSICP
jgi:hypothetical protein